MNCQGLTKALEGSFPPRTPQQIAEEGYLPPPGIPTRPNTPENVPQPAQAASDTNDEGRTVETPQKQATTVPDPATSGKKRRRMEAEAGAQPRDENAMDEDTPDTPTRAARPSTRASTRGGKVAAGKRGAAATSNTARAVSSRAAANSNATTAAPSVPANTSPTVPPVATSSAPATDQPPCQVAPRTAMPVAQVTVPNAVAITVPGPAPVQHANTTVAPTASPIADVPPLVPPPAAVVVPLPAPPLAAYQPMPLPVPNAVLPQPAPMMAHIAAQVAAPPLLAHPPPVPAAHPPLPVPAPNHVPVMAANANAPRVHGISTEDILNNHHPGQRAQWDAFQGPKGLILPFDPGYTVSGAAARVPLLTRAVKAILHLPGDPRIGSPTHTEDTTAPSAPPHFYLLAGITAAQLNILTSGQVWSTSLISFFVLPFTPSPTRYIASFTGLAFPCSAEGIQAVEATFRHDINILDDARALIANFHDNIHGYVSPLATLHNLAAGLSITARDTPQGVVWNLYMDTPTAIPAAYEQWRLLIGGVRVVLAFEGSAIRINPRHCTRCFSRDHTFRICPFPLLPGWLGPGPFVPRPKPSQGRGAHHNHGPRGGGYNNRGR